MKFLQGAILLLLICGTAFAGEYDSTNLDYTNMGQVTGVTNSGNGHNIVSTQDSQFEVPTSMYPAVGETVWKEVAPDGGWRICFGSEISEEDCTGIVRQL